MELIRSYFSFLYAIGFVNRRMGVGRFWGFVITHWSAVIIIGGSSAGALSDLLTVAMLFLTGLSIVQRLNDAGIQRGWILLLLLPYLGWAIMAILLLSSSEAGMNRFGYPGVHTEQQLRALGEKA